MSDARAARSWQTSLSPTLKVEGSSPVRNDGWIFPSNNYVIPISGQTVCLGFSPGGPVARPLSRVPSNPDCVIAELAPGNSGRFSRGKPAATQSRYPTVINY